MFDRLDIPGFLVTMDIEKAFDSLDNDFLLSTLKKYGFIVDKISSSDGQSCVINGGLQHHIWM